MIKKFSIYGKSHDVAFQEAYDEANDFRYSGDRYYSDIKLKLIGVSILVNGHDKNWKFDFEVEF